MPTSSQTAGLLVRTNLSTNSQYRDLPMSIMVTAGTADDGCSDIIYIDQLSLQGIRIYFNDCALQHLSVLATDANAVAGFMGIVSLWCEEWDPVTAGITAGAAAVTATITNLQDASQQCDGAYLDISWAGGWQFEPSCTTQSEGS